MAPLTKHHRLCSIGTVLAMVLAGRWAVPQDRFPLPQAGQTFTCPSCPVFKPCKLSLKGRMFTAKPHFVLRVPDSRGASYGLTDGYSLPFPTPWISQGPNGACNPPPAAQCQPDANVYVYEHGLWGVVPGVASHQFLVYRLEPSKAGYEVGASDWFYNGTQYDHVDERNAAVDSAEGQSPTVDALEVNCPYVLQQSGPDSIMYAGYHAKVGQIHRAASPP